MYEKRLSMSQVAVSDLHRLLVPEESDPNALLCLSVVLDATSLNLRELATYLALINNIYGRLSPSGIYAYSHRPEEQLKIHSVSHGSLELKFIEVVGNTHGVKTLVLIFLLLKYLPGVLESFSKSYRDYQEGRLLRERRKQLREQIKKDKDLAALSNRRKNQVVQLVDALLIQEHRRLTKACSFARTSVRRVRLRIIPRDETHSEHE